MMVTRVEVQRTEPLYRQKRDLPKDVMVMIFDRLSETDLWRCRRVCSQWNVIGRDEWLIRKFEYAFGARFWYKYFGRVGIESPLPLNVRAILGGPCPFWQGRKAHETHLLVLIPEKVNGKPFTLDSLGEMIEKPKGGHPTSSRYFWPKLRKEHGNKLIQGGYWALMTRDVLPGSCQKSYGEQKQQVEKHMAYEVPKVLEAVTCILMEHVKTGRRLYGDAPRVFTRCQEQVTGHRVLVGGFSSRGFGVGSDFPGPGNSGVGAARKL